MSGTTAKQRAYRWGRFAEALSSGLLRLKGYRILGRSLREKVGEIDIIAARGKTLVFVEVKARATLGEAADSVSVKQRQRIIRAAQVFILKHPYLAEFNQRFDVVLVTPWRIPHHIPDAWRPDF